MRMRDILGWTTWRVAVLVVVLLAAALLTAVAVSQGWPAACFKFPQRPTPVVTRSPAPAPTPTAAMVEALPDVAARALSLPAAPVLVDDRTLVLTEFEDYCRWTGDVLLRWRHSNPPGVDYYEVYHGLNQPYSSPNLEGATTALRWLSDAPGQDFVYNAEVIGACSGVTIAGDLDTWRIKACNSMGCSDQSNEIGVITFSVRQFVPAPFGAQ